MNRSYHTNALPAGARVQEYRIECVLGAGGFGIVYLAQNVYLNETVAIKEFLPTQLAQRGEGATVTALSSQTEEAFHWALKKFLNEARILFELGRPEPHPNIVRVTRFHEANGTAYMVMAFEDGESLARILSRERTLDEARLRSIVVPLLDGLEVVHASSVWHRDIKPGNILIRPDGSPVLIDFGAARWADREDARSLVAVFTPEYSAPEQSFAQGEIGPHTDVYALGATLYRAVTGAAPLPPSARALDSSYRSATEAAKPGYSQGFLESIDSALELDARRRPATVSVWREQLLASQISPFFDPKEHVFHSIGHTAVGAGAPREQLEPENPPADMQDNPSGVREPASGAQDHPSRTNEPSSGTQAYPSGTHARTFDSNAAPAYAEAQGEQSVADIDFSQIDRASIGRQSPSRVFWPRRKHHKGVLARALPYAIVVGLALIVLGIGYPLLFRSDNPTVNVEPNPVPANAPPAIAPPAEPGSGPVVVVTDPPSAPALSPPQPADTPPATPVAPPPSTQQPPRQPAESIDDPPAQSPVTVSKEPALQPLGEFLEQAQRAARELPCANVFVRVSDDERAIALAGVAASSAALDGLEAKLKTLGASAVSRESVTISPPPYCQLLSLLSRRANFSGTRTSNLIKLNKPKNDYRGGDALILDVAAPPGQRGYLYILYVDSDGAVVHLLPSPTALNNSVEAGERIAIGDKNEYEIGPPHGKNMLVYIFSPVPLDEGPRAQIESLETFLPTLERNLRAVERTGKKRGLLSRAVVLTTRG